MKHEITFTGQHLSMNHKQIADLVGSRPDNVKVSIERLAERGVIRLPALQDFEEINNLGLPVIREYYNFEGAEGKRDSIVVVAQLSPEYTAQMVDHWQELEREVSSLRISSQPVSTQQEGNMNKDILDIARVVAEATAGATMRAVLDVMGQQAHHTPALPAPAAAPVVEPAIPAQESEFVPVIDLVWKFGLSDAACRRLASYSNLPTKLTNGERGYLLVHNVAFSEAFSCLIEESTQPTGKLKRWQHPDFGGFALKITEANKATVEAKQ
nr:hypothetical protein [Serratia fonticola]